jgi:hypothetical protein
LKKPRVQKEHRMAHSPESKPSRDNPERDGKAESSAEKIRRSAEKGSSDPTAEQDAQTVDAHNELTRPEHSKGRPMPDGSGSSKKRTSNAGQDGP